jgi:anti-anti-sigma factor
MVPLVVDMTATARGSTFSLVGTIDSGTFGYLEDALNRVASAKRSSILVDLSRCEYVSSAGWALLVTARAKSLAGGGDLIITGVHPMLRAMAAHMKAEPLLNFA